MHSCLANTRVSISYHKERPWRRAPARRAQVLHRRPDLNLVDIRGNVETRLRKLVDRDLDVVSRRSGVATAGVRRANH